MVFWDKANVNSVLQVSMVSRFVVVVFLLLLFCFLGFFFFFLFFFFFVFLYVLHLTVVLAVHLIYLYVFRQTCLSKKYRPRSGSALIVSYPTVFRQINSDLLNFQTNTERRRKMDTRSGETTLSRLDSLLKSGQL